LKEKADFDPALLPTPRVRQMDAGQLEEHIRREPSYGRMVCRCESVSEAEVVAAIRRGHTTLDGIKFATRAGMGRCQGGFCTYRVLAIIARETGLPVEAITKRGPGSQIVLGRIGGDRGQDV
jgi:glycerol-3-phosphate dehydrogenase